MGNEVSSSDCRYDALDAAVDRDDLAEVRRLVEVEGLNPGGDPEGGAWANPLLRCTDKRIARFLHSKGCPNYSVEVAVQCDDLDRVKELASTSEDALDAKKACRYIVQSKSAEVARWFYDFAGAGSGREEYYNITTACQVGDLDRIEALAARPGFDVDAGYLKPMPGCGEGFYPYTSEADREELNQKLIKLHRRTSDTKCTMLLYALQAACLRSHPFRPEVAAYLIDELGARTDILVEASRNESVPLLTCAVSEGNLEVVQFLVEKGARTPWEGGSEGAAKCLLAAAALGDGGVEMLHYLLDEEDRAEFFDLACTDKFGRTPLNLACALDREPNVDLLLKKGAVVSSDDIRVACGNCNVLTLALLLDTGAVLPPSNEVVAMVDFRNDKRALNVLILLRSRGVDPEVNVDLAAPHLPKGDDCDDVHIFYALHAATLNGATSCIEFLLTTAGADPDAVGGCPDHPEPGLADDWEGNADLKYSRVYTDGYGTFLPDRVGPVKALFQRAREAKRQGGKVPSTVSSDECAACGKGGDGLRRCTGCYQVRYCCRDCQVSNYRAHKTFCRMHRPGK